MDPYVLALQLYLLNKACGGLPLRITEQIIVTGVINATCWTARTIGSGVMWMVRPATQTTQIPVNVAGTVSTGFLDQPVDDERIKSTTVVTTDIPPDLLSEFEIITLQELKELETI